jgi:hypothetical protein
MPIIQAGKQFTAADVKSTAGNLASLLVGVAQDCTDFGSQLATFPDADLETLGLSTDEIAALKGFFNAELTGITTPIKDSFFLRSLLGLGV